MSDLDEIRKLANERETPEDEEIARLEEGKESERDTRLEERFFWMVACVVLLDAYIFRDMQSWSGPLVIGALEIPMLMLAGRWCQVDVIEELMWFLSSFFRRK